MISSQCFFFQGMTNDTIYLSNKVRAKTLIDSIIINDKEKLHTLWTTTGLITVFDAILPDRKSGQKLQYLHWNPMKKKTLFSDILQIVKNELTNMTRVPDRNRTDDLSKTGQGG